MACVTPLGRDSRLSVLDDDDATLKAVCFDETKSTMKSLPRWNTAAAPSLQAFQLGVIHTVIDVMKDGILSEPIAVQLSPVDLLDN